MAEETTILDTASLDTKPDAFEPAGVQGAVIYNGYLEEREKDSRLAGRQKYVTYSDMLANTTIVAAGVRYFVNLVCKAGWRVEPADESAEAEKIAEQVENIMHDMRTPWNRVVRRAAMSRFWGFSIQEWTAKHREDGTVGYEDIAPRPQVTIERWDVDPTTGRLTGVVQVNPQTTKDIYLPREKIVYMVDDTLNDTPQGLGLFRHLVKTADRLSTYEALERCGFKRDLAGTPIGRAPLSEIQRLVNTGQMSADDASALRKPIEDFIRKAMKGDDTGLLIESAVYKGSGDSQTPTGSKQWDIELMSSESTGQEAIAASIERLNREIARVLGVEQLLLGSDSAGSHALSRDKTQSFGLIVDSTLGEIRETFQQDILEPLFALNGWNTDLMPTFKTEAIQYRDIEQVTQALKDMAQAGAPLALNDPAINEIRTQLGLSDAPEEEALDLDLSGPRGTDPQAQEGETPADEVDSDEDKT